MNTFNCSGCGVCCTKIANAVAATQHIPEFFFPYSWDEQGVCENLTDHKCKIYNDRPLLCNIEKTADYLKLDKNHFYEQNREACNQMMTENNIDETIFIK